MNNAYVLRVTKPLCGSETCPADIITPPDDCHVNYTLSFSLQVSIYNIYVSMHVLLIQQKITELIFYDTVLLESGNGDDSIQVWRVQFIVIVWKRFLPCILYTKNSLNLPFVYILIGALLCN